MHQGTRILVQKQDNNRTENLGDVTLGIKTTSNYDQVCFPTTHFPPQTITLPTPNLSLSGKQLWAAKNAYSAISKAQIETGLICKQDPCPLGSSPT